MNTTRRDRIWNAFRSIAAVAFAGAIASCGGGTESGSEAKVSGASQRMRPLAAGQAAPGLPAIAAGDMHSLGLKSDGTVWAWGEGRFGQLGNNSISGSVSPLQVVGPGGVGALTGVTAISAAVSHSLALKSDGSVWTWGAGPYGELGNNTNGSSLVPVEVVGPGGTGFLADVTAIAGEAFHSLALKSDGTVWAWGLGQYGQLGNNSNASSSVPVQVVGPDGTGALTGVTAIASGEGQTSLTLKSDGTVWAWGWGGDGQLGNNSSSNSSVPVQVVGAGGSGVLTGVTAIASALHSLAVRNDGTVWAWGSYILGKLGNGVNAGNSWAPVQVVGPGGSGVLTGVTAVAAADEHSLALKGDGTVWAWGGGAKGQLGDYMGVSSPTPVQVVGEGGTGKLTGVIAIAAGGFHSLALKSDGTVWAWGSGALGAATTASSLYPVQVVGPGGVGFLNLGSSAATPTTTFTDDFNRADGAIANGWLNTTGNLGGNLLIRNGALTTPGTSGSAGIYRPIDFSAPVTVSATFTQTNGYASAINRYESGFYFGNDGNSVTSGYGIIFSRSDSDYANSSVIVVLNGVQLATIPSTFQFGAAIATTVTFNPADGSLSGTVTGNGNTFAFNFGPRSVTLPGSNFEINLEFPDPRGTTIIAPTLDNLSLTSSSASTTPVLSLAPANLDFGSVAVGGSKELVLTVTNSGAGTLTGTSTASGSFSVMTGAALNVAAGQSQDVIVRFAPAATGVAASQLLLSTNAGNGSVPLNGSGSVVPPPAACVSQVVPWTVSTSSCSATYPGGQSGTSASLSDIIAPDTGTVTASCTNGQLTLTVPVCFTAAPPPPPVACVSQIVPWAVGTSSCSATYPGGQSGTSASLSDIIAPDTGTVTASCTNSQLTLTAPLCVTAPPTPQILNSRVVGLNKAVAVTVSDVRLASSGSVTVETEVRQGTLVQVLRAILGPGSDTRQVFRNLQNGLPASIAVYTIEANGNRTPAGQGVTATPTPPPISATALGTASPPVLLANGFASGGSTWDITLTALGDAFRVSAVTLQNPVFDSPCREALQLRDGIRDLKRQYDSKRVIIVGHSQGGLVARLYLQAAKDPAAFGEYMYSRDNLGFSMGRDCSEALSVIDPFFEGGLNDVAALITYGTPHGGANSVVFNLGSTHPMLREGSGFLAALNNFAADAPFPFPKDTVVTSLIGRTSTISGDDCVVSTDSQNMAAVGYSSPTFRKRTVSWRKHASKGCVISGGFRTTETDDHAAILDALGASVLRINVLSPVDIVVTSPSGRVIEKTSTAIWGATYEEFLDETGDRKKVVTVPFPELGSYQIRVVPDAAAAPTATFSIETELDGTKTTLVDHAPVADATSSPFVVVQRVNNRRPIASAGADQTLQCSSPSGANVTLNGSASSDPDGDALTFTWTGAFGTATGQQPSVTLPLGTNTVGLSVNDGKGGTATASLVIGVVDTTVPVVTYAGNAGAYTVSQTVSITCVATDSGSGIASTTCKSIGGPAYSFALGTNAYLATATDVAGNVGGGSTNFTVKVTTESLIVLTDRFVKNRLIALVLDATLRLAAAAADRGELKVKAKLISAYVAEVRALPGKFITTESAAILIALANAL